jgi:hypothetical protein
MFCQTVSSSFGSGKIIPDPDATGEIVPDTITQKSNTVKSKIPTKLSHMTTHE